METNTPSLPPVLKWYRVYCALMVILYLGLFVAALLGIVFDLRQYAKSEAEGWFFFAYMIFVFGLCIVFGGAYIASFFLPKKSWAWVYHLIMICIGLTSPFCLPVSVPLLIFWFKENTQRYFGREKA